MNPSSIKALTFNVFGTVVDWRRSLIREGEARLNPLRLRRNLEAALDRLWTLAAPDPHRPPAIPR